MPHTQLIEPGSVMAVPLPGPGLAGYERGTRAASFASAAPGIAPKIMEFFEHLKLRQCPRIISAECFPADILGFSPAEWAARRAVGIFD